MRFYLLNETKSFRLRFVVFFLFHFEKYINNQLFFVGLRSNTFFGYQCKGRCRKKDRVQLFSIHNCLHKYLSLLNLFQNKCERLTYFSLLDQLNTKLGQLFYRYLIIFDFITYLGFIPWEMEKQTRVSSKGAM